VSIGEHESLVKIAHEKIKSQKEFIDQVKTSNADDIKILEDRIQTYFNEILQLNPIKEKHIKNYSETSIKLKKIKQKIDDLKEVPSMLVKLETLNTTLLEELQSLETSTTCKCCGQTLPEEQHQKHKVEKHAKAEELFNALKTARIKETQLESLKTEFEIVNNKLEILSNDINALSYKIGNAESNKKILEKEKKEKEAANNLNSFLINLEESEKKKNDIAKKLESFISQQIHYDVVYDILKDGGLKSRIIKHYVPIINGLVNKFLGKLNLYVDFTIDEEFKETIKSRYRDAFSYSSFSEGEKQRIDLAILLTWREVAKMKNSLNCNLLIFDEILDSSLDAAGTEAFMKILNKMKNKCSIYIISHKADALVDKFDQTLQFEKKNNFSKIKVQV
jgi:DNA repair exonuclease SbcCD ATPase subunit